MGADTVASSNISQQYTLGKDALTGSSIGLRLLGRAMV